MDRRHTFISIEGLSGSGKTTISQLLAEELGAHWYTTPPTIFRPIRGDVEAKATPFARHLYYYAGIAQASAEIELILRQKPVVCDKFMATMLAYSRAAGIKVGIPSPDLVISPDFSFLLQVPDSLRWKRIVTRGTMTPEHENFLRMEIACDVMRYFRDLELVTQDNSVGDVAVTVAEIQLFMKRAPGRSDTR